MGKIVAVCWSDKKGIVKKPIAEAVIKENFGLEGDAHADSTTNRQVSLMSIESIKRMKGLGFPVEVGSFAENLTTQDIELLTQPIGTQITVGKDVLLEITQIGKKCHSGCAIFQQVGQCIMPKEGVFTKVIHGGKVKAGDEIKIKNQIVKT